MRSTDFLARIRDGGTVLCLGAHSDDIEIGCGGMLGKLIEGNRGLNVQWVVFSANGVREREARSSAEAMLSSVENTQIVLKQFRNGFFPYVASDIKEFFETLKTLPAPDLVLTHYRNDLHQDHRVVSELTWNTFRNHIILEYEVPKFDGDLGIPNVFVTLTESQLAAKAAHLETHFISQLNKQWFTRDTFTSLSRIRGIECNSTTGFAEAFHGRKIVLD